MHRTWGSVVFSTKHVMTEIAVTEPALKGWIAGGRIEEFVVGERSPRPLAVFSIHTPSPGPYDKNVDQIITDIKEITPADCDLVIGGDFNVTTALRHKNETLQNTPAEKRIIERLRTELDW
jgi:hypothetical protein